MREGEGAGTLELRRLVMAGDHSLPPPDLPADLSGDALWRAAPAAVIAQRIAALRLEFEPAQGDWSGAWEPDHGPLRVTVIVRVGDTAAERTVAAPVTAAPREGG